MGFGVLNVRRDGAMKDSVWNKWTCPALSLGLLLATGCGREASGVKISGNVAFADGAPIEHGMIVFESMEPGSSARVTAVILKGAYDIPRTERIVPGKYRVMVHQPDETDIVPGPPGMVLAKPPRDLVSEEFNSKSKLEAVIDQSADFEFNYRVDRSKL